jgi:outer membrane protein assembly factor BamB
MSTDTGLLKQWPEDGPKLLWTAEGLGQGWATVAIADGQLHTAGNIGDDTIITTLDPNGQELWRAANGPAFKGSHRGARATPTVVGGRLYHLNGDGYVVCLDAATGERIWATNILEQFGGRNIQWALSESLLVDEGRVICCPGGEEVSFVALDADTGDTLWQCTGVGDKPGYAAPILVEYGGLRQVVTMMSASAVGIAADTGTLLWRYPHEVRFEANCTSPLYHDGHVALFGTWGRGATLLKLTVTGKTCTAEEVWRTTELDNEHGGVILLDGYLYGHSDGDHKDRHLTCLDMATGKTMWTADELAGDRSATVTFADGMLYLMTDRAEVALIRPNPERLEIVSQFRLPEGGKGAAYAHLVVCGGRLHIRHGDFLYVYDVRDGG